jgi:MFS family permease
LLVVAAGGAVLFGASQGFVPLVLARALIGLGVAAALTAGLKAIVLWFPKERVALVNGYLMMLGTLGAVTATAPAELLLAWTGWRGLFDLLAVATAATAVMIYFVVPEAECVGIERFGTGQPEDHLFRSALLAAGADLRHMCRDGLGATGTLGSTVAHRRRGNRPSRRDPASLRHGGGADHRGASPGYSC